MKNDKYFEKTNELNEDISVNMVSSLKFHFHFLLIGKRNINFICHISCLSKLQRIVLH